MITFTVSFLLLVLFLQAVLLDIFVSNALTSRSLGVAALDMAMALQLMFNLSAVAATKPMTSIFLGFFSVLLNFNSSSASDSSSLSHASNLAFSKNLSLSS